MKRIAQRHRTKASRTVVNLPTEEIEQEKPLFLIMQKVWFDKIESGEKTEEYRDNTEFYQSRLLNKAKTAFKNYRTVILQIGYNSDAKRMTVEIEKITLKRDFTIHLGKILERTNF
ncbi:hypothetical protein CEY12_06355 [Chryseobacterium sp. T16E-39]|uniref:hypothetical protein n=1 Tax=Chryseobacterium sp. T16E-39 TaxID=2015076 RepID=UPI000B5B1B67|nr:hypothetical protein [Chryseobacterium sp. T16E-39]ASK29750.1 hypothetical protein CEY12_06355 [Chryseobacterium sp. T16E-39]